MHRAYEDIQAKFGKEQPKEDDYCKPDGEHTCPAYVARGSRCTGRRTIICSRGANITGRGYGEVTRFEADECLARLRAETEVPSTGNDMPPKTPPGP
jgi:hypothetical protein